MCEESLAKDYDRNFSQYTVKAYEYKKIQRKAYIINKRKKYKRKFIFYKKLFIAI